MEPIAGIGNRLQTSASLWIYNPRHRARHENIACRLSYGPSMGRHPLCTRRSDPRRRLLTRCRRPSTARGSGHRCCSFERGSTLRRGELRPCLLRNLSTARSTRQLLCLCWQSCCLFYEQKGSSSWFVWQLLPLHEQKGRAARGNVNCRGVFALGRPLGRRRRW